MKRVLKWVGVVVGVIAVAIGVVWFIAFGSNSPIADRTDIAPGVEGVKDGFVAAYILDAGKGQVALVDAGNDGSAKSILTALSAKQLDASSVAAIFLTHGHGDHTAGCKALPNAKVYAMEGDVALASDNCKITKPLHDGDAVDVGDLRVEAFSVPGHTPGSAVYLARNVLFFGDSAGASKDGVVMPAVKLFSKSSAENVASLKALAERLRPRASDVHVLAFGHTGPLRGLDPLLAFASSH